MGQHLILTLYGKIWMYCHGQPVLIMNLKEIAVGWIGTFGHIEDEKWLGLAVTSAFLDDAVFGHFTSTGQAAIDPNLVRFKVARPLSIILSS